MGGKGLLPYTGDSRRHGHTRPLPSGCNSRHCSMGYYIPAETEGKAMSLRGRESGRQESGWDEAPPPHFLTPAPHAPGAQAPQKIFIKNSLYRFIMKVMYIYQRKYTNAQSSVTPQHRHNYILSVNISQAFSLSHT